MDSTKKEKEKRTYEQFGNETEISTTLAKKTRLSDEGDNFDKNPEQLLISPNSDFYSAITTLNMALSPVNSLDQPSGTLVLRKNQPLKAENSQSQLKKHRQVDLSQIIEDETQDKTEILVEKTNTKDGESPMKISQIIELNFQLFSVAIPTIFSGLTLLLIESVSLIFVGQMNNTYAMAGVGLSIIYTNFVSLSPLTGLGSALSVQVSIEAGRKDYQKCETILQRGRVIAVIAALPLCIFQLLQYEIMVMCGIDSEVASYAYQFGIFLFLAMCIHMQFDCYRSYLNATGQSKILQFITASTLLVHVALCYFLIQRLNMGVAGASLSTMVTMSLNCILVILYAWKFSKFPVSPIPRDIPSLLHKADVADYLRIGLPCIVMGMAEWCAAEILILIAASISVGAVGAMSICYNFYNLLYYFPYGL